MHTPQWVRANLEAACFLLLHHRDDFVRGEWPDTLKLRVADQARKIESCVKRFARETFNSTNSTQLSRSSFVLLEVPLAAVRPHLRRAERPPAIVDELIRTTYSAIIGACRSLIRPQNRVPVS